MLQVFCASLDVDEDVIQMYHGETISERIQDIIHHPLEICCGICQTKGHDQPFKKTFF
jgi:hypothetical protein